MQWSNFTKDKMPASSESRISNLVAELQKMEVRITFVYYFPFVATESAGPAGSGVGEVITVGNSPPICTGAGN